MRDFAKILINARMSCYWRLCLFVIQVKGILDEILEKLPEEFNLMELTARAEEKTPCAWHCRSVSESHFRDTTERTGSWSQYSDSRSSHSLTHYHSGYGESERHERTRVCWPAPAYERLQQLAGFFNPQQLLCKRRMYVSAVWREQEEQDFTSPVKVPTSTASSWGGTHRQAHDWRS